MLTYSLVGNAEDESFFSIDGQTGQIYLLQQLYLSQTDRYSVSVFGPLASAVASGQVCDPLELKLVMLSGLNLIKYHKNAQLHFT